MKLVANFMRARETLAGPIVAQPLADESTVRADFRNRPQWRFEFAHRPAYLSGIAGTSYSKGRSCLTRRSKALRQRRCSDIQIVKIGEPTVSIGSGFVDLMLPQQIIELLGRFRDEEA